MSAAAELLRATMPGAAPAYMTHLVDRAAMLLHTRRTPCVDFTWWADGETSHYFGRFEWEFAWPRPRVVVRDKNGEFVCQSTAEDFWTIDPSTWHIDVSEDDHNRALWLEAAPHAAKGGRR